MRAVAQRVRWARVVVAGEEVARMGAGLLALVGVGREDGEKQAVELARRLVYLRVFAGASGRMERSVLDSGGTLGLVSQFTLMADARQGRRPSYAAAAPGARAEPLLERLADEARALGAPVVTGRFGALMEVELANSGPVTILLDTDRVF